MEVSDLAEILDEAMLTHDNDDIEAAFAFVAAWCDATGEDLVDVVVESDYASIYFAQWCET